MGFIDENRKVLVTAGGKTWIFKTLDGSLLEAPAGATDVMTEKVTEIAQKYLEPISGTDEDSFEVGISQP